MLRVAPRVARFLMRWRLPIVERKRMKALEKTFQTVKDYTIRFEGRGFAANDTLFNIALFFLLAERDIQCMKIDALTHPDEWTRKLCARVIILVIYEMDLDKVSGQALRTALETIGASEEMRKEATDSLRTVRAVQSKLRKEFSFVRNATIGHRDADALLQYRSIRDIRTERVFELAAEFYAGAKGFIDLLPRMMLASSKLDALLRQTK